MRKMYIAVLDEVPDHMVPVLIAHSVINGHRYLSGLNYEEYKDWLDHSFRKVVVSVNQKQFDSIRTKHIHWGGYENTTLNGEVSCAVVLPCNDEERSNVLKYAKMWEPKC